jgi:DNA-binding MarR family transcriptional regulator
MVNLLLGQMYQDIICFSNMNATETPAEHALDELAATLLQNASLLTRLLFRHADAGISRSEASLLARLEGGPERITMLAEHEGLAQPTITRLVEQVEKYGWVRRERAPEDGRVVLVSLTADGRATLREFRARYRPWLIACLAALPDEQVEALEGAAGAMAALVGEMQKAGAR